MTSPWLTPTIRALYGIIPDREIAAAAGVTLHAVRMARIAERLPVGKRGPRAKGRVVVEVSVLPETLARIDAVKGGRSRGEVVDALLGDACVVPA